MKIAFMILIFASSLEAQGLVGHSLLVSGAAADLVTTRMALRRGAVETSLIGSSLKAQVGVKIGLVAGMEALSWAAKKDGHPTLARNNLIVWGLAQLGASAWNYHVIKEQRR